MLTRQLTAHKELTVWYIEFEFAVTCAANMACDCIKYLLLAMLVLVLAVQETDCILFSEQLLHRPGVSPSACSPCKLQKSSTELPNMRSLQRCNGSPS